MNAALRPPGPAWRIISGRGLRRFATGKSSNATTSSALRVLQRCAASLARPRLMHRFNGEVSEVLVHSLGSAFDGGEDHANYLSPGHALRRTRPAVRRQK